MKASVPVKERVVTVATENLSLADAEIRRIIKLVVIENRTHGLEKFRYAYGK